VDQGPVNGNGNGNADDFDFGDDGRVSDADAIAALAELDRLTLALERAQAEQKRLDEAAAKAKQLVDRLSTKEIPDLLRRLCMEKGTTKSGLDFVMKQDIRATLAGQERIADRTNGFQWLVENGHGGVIKNKVAVELDRGEDERADALALKLRAEGFDAQLSKIVDPQTLSALFRELYRAGKIVPVEYFNVHDNKVVKITRKQ
jgi:hypothetical protein